MIIKTIAFGDASGSFVENRLSSGFNIIFSDDNNKGKTIVMQSALYAIGNEAIFPSSFPYKNYYHYVEVELDNGNEVISCRKGDSFVVKADDGISILDSVSELKRYFSRRGFVFPEIVKDNSIRMVDPVLLYQIFFVGQDNKNTSSIFNDNYYKKDDFWNMIYALMGVGSTTVVEYDPDFIREKIAMLIEEKKVLLSKNSILKKNTPTMELISQRQNNDAFSEKVKKIEKVREAILEATKSRNRALQRKTINEKTLKEIRALNRTPESGDLYCLDCGSKKIGYSSGDKAYTFDISDVDMRRNITESIQDKIDAYQEEIDNCTAQINSLQRQLQKLLREEEIDLESILMYKNGVAEITDADTRIAEIDKEIKLLKADQKAKKQKSEVDQEKRDELRACLIATMNSFYKEVDPDGSLIFTDLFSKKGSTYSGCEETEFYLSKLYAMATILGHHYPVMMDFFRDGELSTEKESVVLSKFTELSNQIIFTATLKKEELGKYDNMEGITAIDYSSNAASHVLNDRHISSFAKLLKPLMLNL